MRHDSYHHGTTFYSQSINNRSGSGINQQPMSYAYREDTGRKDQGWALFDKGSAPPVPDEDGPAIMDVAAPVASEDDRTYETSSKLVVPITTSAKLIPCRSEDTSVRPDYGDGPNDAPLNPPPLPPCPLTFIVVTVGLPPHHILR
jgi:hypothetical protein